MTTPTITEALAALDQIEQSLKARGVEGWPKNESRLSAAARRHARTERCERHDFGGVVTAELARISPDRARLLQEYKAERIDEANAADFAGAAYRDDFPTRERVARWNREWLAMVDRERKDAG